MFSEEALYDSDYEFDRAQMIPGFKKNPDVLFKALETLVEIEEKERNKIFNATNPPPDPNDPDPRQRKKATESSRAARAFFLSFSTKGVIDIIDELKKHPKYRKKLEELAQALDSESLLKEYIEEALKESKVQPAE